MDGDAYAAACAAWPGVTLSREAFETYVEARVTAETPRHALRTEDLFLAAACAAGDSAAIEAFERSFRPEIDAAVARMDRRGMSADDLVQALRAKLFTAADGPPKITAYGGRGRLRNWVRITVLRMRVDAERDRASGKEVAASDRANIIDGALVADDPELAFLKQHYRDAFRRALAEAFGQLEPRDRVLLRQRLIDRLTNEQMAQLHRVHKATLKRWNADIRERLLAHTRAALQRELGTDREGFDSVMRLIASRFDVSIHRFLETTER